MTTTTLTQFRDGQLMLQRIKTAHRHCPARVLYGGRCPKTCPYYDSYRTCGSLEFLDHLHVRAHDDGGLTFVSVHHNTDHVPYLEDATFKSYCERNGLRVTTERGTFNECPGALFVLFEKA